MRVWDIQAREHCQHEQQPRHCGLTWLLPAQREPMAKSNILLHNHHVLKWNTLRTLIRKSNTTSTFSSCPNLNTRSLYSYTQRSNWKNIGMVPVQWLWMSFEFATYGLVNASQNIGSGIKKTWLSQNLRCRIPKCHWQMKALSSFSTSVQRLWTPTKMKTMLPTSLYTVTATRWQLTSSWSSTELWLMY